MTKSELIERLAQKQPQLAYRDIELAVKAVLELMTQQLANGDRIEIRGFGSFGGLRIRGIAVGDEEVVRVLRRPLDQIGDVGLPERARVEGDARGVGLEAGFAPPIRFSCPPEVSLLVLGPVVD